MKNISIFELISFLTGFCLLSFELVAARLLAPTIGSSTYVWTGVIGVIIAALSLGFWIGGRLADTRNRQSDIALLLLAAAASVAAAIVLQRDILLEIASSRTDVRFQAVVAALLLFAPCSFFIGTISPYLTKCRVRSLSTSARSVASLDAMNAIGGIVGTFLTGFVLFGYVGSCQTLIITALLLVAMSWLVMPKYKIVERIGVSVLITVLAIIPVSPSAVAIDIDTASAHYQIQDFLYENKAVRGLSTGPNGIQSGVFINGLKQPVFWYTKELARITLEKHPQSILVLGGGTFTLPEYLAQKLPNSHIDVVEIDPKLEHIAKQYFNYSAPANVTPIFTDARQYVNTTNKTYDAIIVDAYGDSEIPFSLMTKEYGRTIAKRVAPQGIILANIIGGINGPCREVFDAANAAYANGLRYGSYIMNFSSNPKRANIIGLYSNTANRYGLRRTLSHGAVYSDNFMPADRLSAACERVQ